MSSEYDIIFAGGGTTACVIAGRLIASNPSLKILVVESGKHSLDVPNITQPCRYVEHIAEASATTTRHKSKPSPFLDGREAAVLTGHALGGGSAVNFMIYARGARSDYDNWAALGNKGWGYEDLLPLIKKLETYMPLSQRSTHGYQGPIQISAADFDLGIGTEFLNIVRKYDPTRPRVDDNNDFTTANAYSPAYKYIISGTGRRSDAASRYLYPQTHNPNLEILVETLVKRVIFDINGRAIGIEHMANGVTGPVVVAKARQLVVVSAGALGSPGILERSGIGSSFVLDPLGIPTVVNLPGVGENYQDHLSGAVISYVVDENDTMDDVWSNSQATTAYLDEWQKTGKGKISTNGFEVIGKLRPTEEDLKVLGPNFKSRWKLFFEHQPDKSVALIFVVAGLPIPGLKVPRRLVTLPYFITYTESVGSVHISDGQVLDAPLDFDTGFLSKLSDIALLTWLYKRTRELVRRLPSYRGEMTALHPKFPDGSAAAAKEHDTPVLPDAPDIVYTEADDEAIAKFHRDTASATYHSLGTCAMKPRDQGGVVDARLNVYGVQGLKVADLSICPTNVGNNTNSTALLIGEKAAVIIAQDLNLSLN